MMEIVKLLNSIECDEVNVSNICDKVFAGTSYKYSFGSSKVCVETKDFFIKRVYGNTSLDEMEVYRKAVEYGVKEFFTFTYKIQENPLIYLQEKVNPLNKYISGKPKVPYGSLREDYREKGLQQMLYRSDCCVLFYLFKFYSLEEILKLQDFIIENDITDLNFYNAGFDRRGKICFFDFSGIDENLFE